MQALYREPLTLDSTTRASLSGQYVTLSGGVTHYQMAGPEDGQPIILISGFSTPLYIWDHNFDALAEAGLRVVRYDLFGRGYSDRPPVTYTPDVFDRQLLDLIDALGLVAPDLVGLSMGGAIAITFADRHPDRLRKLALIDPAGFPIKVTLSALLLFLPVVGEIVMALAGNRVLLGGLPRDLHHPERFPEYVAQYKAQLPYRGLKRALLSTMRHMPLTNMAELYARVGQQDREVLLIWGREDATIPLSTSERVLAAIPHAKLHIVEDAGHIAHYERPDAVNPLLIAFLRT